MRKKRKVWYEVTDTGRDVSLWWCRGEWREFESGKMSGASSHKSCRNLDNAFKACKKINLLGGKGLILQWTRRNGKRALREMWETGFLPWS